MRLILNLLAVWLCMIAIFSEAVSQQLSTEPLPEPAVFGEIPDSLFDQRPGHDYPYEYLLNNVEIQFREEGGRIAVILDYHYRIKVLSDEPEDLAEAAMVAIPYYFYEDLEEVTDLEAVTHQPDGRQAELGEEDIRTSQLNPRYNIIELIMPDVAQGSIIEYRYRLYRRYIDELPDVHLTQNVPTSRFHLTLHNEDYIRYDVVKSNVDFELNYREERIDTSSVPLVFSFSRPEPVLKQHWFARDIPAYEEAAYTVSPADLRSSLMFQVSEFGRPRQPLENSWELVAAQIRRGGQNPFHRAGEEKTLLDKGRELASELDSRDAAADSVFRYLNRRMEFNGEFRSFPDTPLEYVLDGEPADQAAINTVLLALLKGAGVEAWPVYLSGRQLGQIDMTFPSVYQFNQMLLAVEDRNGLILMDASFSHSRPGLIPVESYNQKAMVLKPDSHEWVDLSPTYSYFEFDVTVNGTLSENGDLEGEIRIVTDGYPVREIRSELQMGKTSAAILRDSFFDAYSEVEIRSAAIQQADSGAYPLELKAEFRIPEYAVSFREGLQFRPMVVGYLQANPFGDDERNTPVMLDAPERFQVSYRITMPAGHAVEEARFNQVTALNGASLREHYDVSGQELRYRFDVEIDRREFSQSEYNRLLQFYERWVYLSTNEWFIGREDNL